MFFDAKNGYNPQDYSHVTIMGANGEMISSPDVVNESAVHYETLAQHPSSGAYDTYVGWWLPDGNGSSSAGTIPGRDIRQLRGQRLSNRWRRADLHQQLDTVWRGAAHDGALSIAMGGTSADARGRHDDKRGRNRSGLRDCGGSSLISK